MDMERFRKTVEPSQTFIGRGRQTQTLYRLEDKRSAAIKACAQEWMKLQGVTDYWGHGLPQALFDTLNSTQPESAAIAAEKFLRELGWKLERPTS